MAALVVDFPSFSEGLSLRPSARGLGRDPFLGFPFLFGGTFIEASTAWEWAAILAKFPFLFGGTFIEADVVLTTPGVGMISLPFRRDFH